MSGNLIFDLHETYGRDLAGAFAPNTVRFQNKVNIAADLNRAIRSKAAVSHLFVVGANNVTVVVEDLSVLPRAYGVMNYPTSDDPAVLTAVGQRDLAMRKLQTDVPKFPILTGFDPENGAYTPGPPGSSGHVWVGDTVRLHTGTDAHHYNEVDFPVAAINWTLSQARKWEVTVELGASYLSRQKREFEENVHQIIKGTYPSPHSHPELGCRPMTGVPPEFIVSANNPDNSGGAGSLTVPAGLTNAALFIAVPSILGTTFPPTTVSWNGELATLYDTEAHPTQGGIGLYYILDPSPGNAMLDTSNGNGVIGAWLYEGVDQTTPIAAAAFVTGTSAAAAASMAAVTGCLPVAAMTVDDDDFVDDGGGTAPVAVAGLTADWASSGQAGSPGYRDMQYAGGHDDWSAGWTLNESHPWTAFVAAINGSGGVVGDGLPELVGGGSRFAWCSHRHDVHRDAAPTSSANEATGYKVAGITWAVLDDLDSPTEILSEWVLVDPATGLWLERPSGGVTDHGDLTGLGDNDHPQYAMDTDLADHAADTDLHGGGGGSEAWMPLTTVVGGEPELVWDDDDSLIPTSTAL
jgi:hypothetical protein